MRRLPSLFLALILAAMNAFAAGPYYVRDCGAGAEGSCTNNADDSLGGLSDANAFKNCSAIKSLFNTFAPNTVVRFAKGGAWDDCDLNFTGAPNTLTTGRNNPIIFESYTPSTGGTVAPKLTRTGGVLFGFVDSGNTTHDEGYIVRDLHLIGSTSTLQSAVGTGINVGADNDYVIIDNVEIEGFDIGIRCNGGTTNSVDTPNGGDGLSDHFTVRNSNIHHNHGQGLELSCGDMLIENNTLSNNGANVGDHNVYVDDRGTGAGLGNVNYAVDQIVFRGNTFTANSQYTTVTVSSTNTATDTFSATNDFVANEPVAMRSSGTMPGGVTQYQTYYILSPTGSTFKLSATPGGAAVDVTSAGSGTIRTTAQTVRTTACKSTSLVMHGEKRNILIENNIFREDGIPTSASCWALGIDAGQYAAAGLYGVEGFLGVTVRGNTFINYPISISLDIAAHAIVENNYIYTETVANTFGMKMRGKQYEVPDGDNDQVGADITIRNNSVYLAFPDANSIGIWTARHASDLFSTTTGINVYSNLIHFATGTSSATMCFNIQNFTYSQFGTFDYNLCNFAGTQGVWVKDGTTASPTTKTLAAWTTASGFDSHSFISNNAASTIFSATPGSGNNYSLATKTTSPTKNTGHPSLSSRLSIFGIVRSGVDANPDIGAFEFGQGSTAAPPSPTRINVSSLDGFAHGLRNPSWADFSSRIANGAQFAIASWR